MTEAEVTTATGLSEAEARRRLSVEGHNELPRSRGHSLAMAALRALAEPMFLLLLGAAGIYVLLGDRTEALILLASVAVIIVITIYQERKTERVLEALRDLSSPRALVLRDGEQRRIPGREVVRDDLLVVREGDRVAADGILIAAADLRVDESLLTGESVPVGKLVALGTAERDDSIHRVFAGCLVVNGHGLAQVTATGTRTEMGAIGQSLASLGLETTALQAETRRLVRTFSAIAIGLCLLLIGFDILAGAGALNALLAGLTLAMAILPEEFPVVLAVFLALGAWRLSRVNVLTRRVGAIEALGAATVLCVDKTGTLTQNRMSVRRLWADGARVDLTEHGTAALPASLEQAVRVSIMASEPRPFDPMERAFHELRRAGPELEGELVRRYPMSPGLLVVTHVWRHHESSRMTVAAKGAPESIVALCGLRPEEAADVMREASAMAGAGLRVLGLAASAREAGELPEDPRALEPRFVGLVGLADPLRPTVPQAMRECRDAGVRVVMITGDYPATALAIGREAGLAKELVMMTGRELDAISDSDLRERLSAVNVFARVVPAQKLRIVTALKARHEIVAMTGDGVNDGPALKAAHIGIAMGKRGTDVAREAAALVLLDDDFGSIVQAIRQGRRIFDNLRKAMSYIVSVHIPIAGLGLVPVMLGAPPILFPAHVVFLEFIIDPACSIAFEAEPAEADVMRRPPRDRAEPLIGGWPLLLALLEGGLALAFTLGIYGAAVAAGKTEPEVRLLAFSAVVLANLSLIFFARSGGRRVWRHIVARNPSLWWVFAGTLLAYVIVLAVPAIRAPFRLAPFTVDNARWLTVALLLFWVGLAALNAAQAWVLARLRENRARARGVERDRQLLVDPPSRRDT
jgi:Ca2+-transporting ATPase